MATPAVLARVATREEGLAGETKQKTSQPQLLLCQGLEQINQHRFNKQSIFFGEVVPNDNNIEIFARCPSKLTRQGTTITISVWLPSPITYPLADIEYLRSIPPTVNVTSHTGFSEV